MGRLDRLAAISGADDDRPIRGFVEIERVEWVAGRGHHVVADVDDVVDRAEADRLQSSRDVFGGRLDCDAFYRQRGVAVAYGGGFDFDFRTALAAQVPRYARDDRVAPQRGRQLPRHSAMRHRVDAIRRHFEIE